MWFKKDKDYNSVFSTVNQLEQNLGGRREEWLTYARMYSNRAYQSMGLNSYFKIDPSLSQSRITMNLVKSNVDTLQAKVAKNKPRPLFLTSGGDWDQQEKAKNLTDYSDGVLDEMSFYETMQAMFVDACVFGTGAMSFYPEADGKIKCERVLINEIVIDEQEAIYGSPRQLHRIKYISKSVLKELYAKENISLQVAIENAQIEAGSYRSNGSTDMIKVVESWHLPSSESASDGKHSINISTANLFEENYKKDFFPIQFFRFSDPQLGFFGGSVSEIVKGYQSEANKILRRIQESYDKIVIPRVFLPTASKAVKAHLTPEIGAIVPYQGSTPPIFQTPSAFPAEVYQHLERLRSYSFEDVGNSQMSAQAQRMPGIDSGIAIREMNDIESERHVILAQKLERFVVNCMRVIINLTRDEAVNNKKLQVKIKKNKVLKTIKWKEVDIPEDDYILRCFPTSLLPTQPYARLQTIKEMIADGMIDKVQGKALLNFPDLEAAMDLEDSSWNLINQTLQEILTDKKYSTPEQYMDLNLAITLGQNYYLEARFNKVDEERLELMRRWIDDVNALIQTMKASQVTEQQAAQPTAMQ